MLFNKRKIFSILFYIAALVAAIMLALRFDVDPGKTSLIVTSFLFLAMGVQYLLPEERKPRERGELLTDFLYFIFITVLFSGVSNYLVQLVTQAMAPGVLVSAGIITPGGGLQALPLWVQVPLFMLCVDLGFYWTHRLAHTSPLLFRFHAMHHMPHRVSVLNGSRAHPVDSLWRRAVPTLLVLQLGFGKDAVGMGMMLMSMIGVMQHMNADFEFGFLNRVFGTNEGHRWHHSTIVEESRNYGLLSVWDQLWGTYLVSDTRQRPAAMGLEDQGDVPVHHFFYHLILPFMPQRKKSAALPQAV